MTKQEPLKIKGVGDIVFCIDCTASMTPCFDGVKANVDAFAGAIKDFVKQGPPINWRARVVGYRDFNADSDYLIDRFDFVSTPEELRSQLSAIEASGGGDEPESTLDTILYAAKKSNWRDAAHKMVVVFTDAPPIEHLHSRTTTELKVEDSIDLILQELRKLHIKLFLFGPPHPIYEEIGKVSRLTFVPLPAAHDGLKSADFEDIMTKIGKTLSQTVTGEVK